MRTPMNQMRISKNQLRTSVNQKCKNTNHLRRGANQMRTAKNLFYKKGKTLFSRNHKEEVLPPSTGTLIPLM